MAGNLKLKNIGTLFFCPEVTQGTANYDNTTTALGTSTTAIVAGLGGSDDMFIGLQMYFYSGANAGRLVTITDYVSSTGTFTFTPADGGSALSAVASGEKFTLGSILPNAVPTVNGTTKSLTREWESDTLDKPSDLVGLSESTVSAEVHIGGLESSAGDGIDAPVDRFTRFLEMIGEVDSGTGTKIASNWSSATSGSVSSIAGLSVNSPIMVNNEVAIIDTISGTTITVHPAFSSNPQANDVVYAGQTFTPDDTGHLSCTFCHVRDDQLFIATGVVGNFKTSGAFNDLFKFTFDGQGDGWDVEDSYSDIDGIQSSVKPIALISARVHFGDTTLWCNSMDFDFGHGIENLEDCNAGVQKLITTRASVASVTFRNANKTALTTWNKEKTKGTLVIQAGGSPADCVVLYGDVQIVSVEDADYGGVRGYKASLKFYDDRQSLTASKPRLARL